MLTKLRPITRESGALMHLSIPIILTQIATQAMGFVDTTMAGQVSPADLAAIALGTSLWIPVLLLLRGVIMALTPVVAYHRGAHEFQVNAVAFFLMVWVELMGGGRGEGGGKGRKGEIKERARRKGKMWIRERYVSL